MIYCLNTAGYISFKNRHCLIALSKIEIFILKLTFNMLYIAPMIVLRAMDIYKRSFCLHIHAQQPRPMGQICRLSRLETLRLQHLTRVGIVDSIKQSSVVSMLFRWYRTLARCCFVIGASMVEMMFFLSPSVKIHFVLALLGTVWLNNSH